MGGLCIISVGLSDNRKVVAANALTGLLTVSLPSAPVGFRVAVQKTDNSPNPVNVVDDHSCSVASLSRWGDIAALEFDGTSWFRMPGGAIFDSGRNANGEFVRFANGRMECLHSDGPLMDTATMAFNIARSSAPSVWTFPSPFAPGTLPAVRGMAVNHTGRWINAYARSNSGAIVAQMGSTVSATLGEERLDASGWWLDPVLSPGTLTLLCMGQSNAWFQGTGGPWDISPNVSVWNCSNNILDLTALGNRWGRCRQGDDPFRLPDAGLHRNNFFAHAAQHLHMRTGKNVRIILVAANGMPIERWVNGNARADLYTRMQAVLSAAGVHFVDAMLWMQGEADDTSAGTYPDQFDEMLGFLDADKILSSLAPVVVGSVAPARANIKAVLESLPLTRPRVKCADVGSLTTIDGVHFAGSAAPAGGALFEANLATLMGLI